MLDQAVCIFAHLKEICLFLCRMYFHAALRAFSVFDLALCIECLALFAVHAFVCAFINIAFFIKLAEDLLNLNFMIRIRCADKAVIGSIHQIPDALYFTCSFINKFLRGFSCRDRFVFDLLSMLVSSCLETYIIAFHSAETCDRIC